MPSTLGYWKIRGFAQPIRLMLAFGGEEFEDKTYECGDGPSFNLDSWLNEKFNLGLDFPNLPYYLNGDVKLSQSTGIMRHLGRKFDLMGKTGVEKDRCDLAAEQLLDLRTRWVAMGYGKVSGPKPGDYFDAMTETLTPFERFLGDDLWIAGDSLTWADFLLWELLDQHLAFKPHGLADCPKLRDFHGRFAQLPVIKSFMESDKCFKGPINNKMAQWGGQYPVPAFTS